MRILRVSSSIVLVIAIAAIAGCHSTMKRNPVPVEYATTAQIEGLEGWRFTGDASVAADAADLKRHAERFASQLRGSGLDQQPIRYLGISGGGAKGAFGAGLLCGWSVHGTRPEFLYVTGISTRRTAIAGRRIRRNSFLQNGTNGRKPLSRSLAMCSFDPRLREKT